MKRTWALALSLLTIAAILFGIYLSAGPAQIEHLEYPSAPHSNIAIGSDSDFTRVGAGSGCECVRSGTGSERDPYLISNWVVNASGVDGISVFGTSAHFLIRRVEVSGDSMEVGIWLDSVRNAKIEDSSIIGGFVGIYAFRSSNLSFVNVTVSGNEYGIQLEGSNDSILSASRFEGNEMVAVFVRGSDNVVKNNEVTNSGFGGINIDGTAGSANRNLVEGNIVTGSKSYGIGMWRAADCVVRRNIVKGNGGVGIMLTEMSNSNTVEENNVTENKGNGIFLAQQSTGNMIRANTANANGDGINAFDLHDMGSNNIWENNTYSTKRPDTIN